MSTWYLDTPAALKLILEEAESAALIEAINAERPTLAASYLLETELRRSAQRSPSIGQARVTDLLDRVDLYEIGPATFRHAGLLPGAQLRSLDAVHLASAISIGSDEIATYDLRMAQAAVELGLLVIAPR